MRPAPGERMAIRPHCTRGAEGCCGPGCNGDSAQRADRKPLLKPCAREATKYVRTRIDRSSIAAHERARDQQRVRRTAAALPQHRKL